MREQSAEMSQPETAAASATAVVDRANLDRQYGSIGISAVAAALRYGGQAKNPAYAPTSSQPSRQSDFDARSLLTI